MILSEIVLVHEDARLRDCNKNKGRRLQDPMNSYAILVTEWSS